MQDAWRAYLELALGLTEASKRKAQQVVKKMVGQSGTTAAQLQALAEELVSTSAANRDSLTKLVRSEVDRALGLVGVATAEEVADLNARVRALEGELRQARERLGAAPATPLGGAPGGAPGTVAGPGPGAAQKAVAKKAVAKKAVAKRAPAEKAVAKKTVAKKTTVRKADTA